METTHNTREGGASLSPVVAGTPVTMSTLASDLGPTHHMASEPGPGPRNHKAAVAAGDTQSDGAFRRQDIQAKDVHPFSSPGASQRAQRCLVTSDDVSRCISADFRGRNRVGTIPIRRPFAVDGVTGGGRGEQRLLSKPSLYPIR